MNKIRDKLDWFKEPEERKWKRIVNSIELAIIGALSFCIIIIVLINGNGAYFQSAFVLFLSLLAVSTVLMIPSIYNANYPRYIVKLITLGFGCGAGISALAGFLILESQLVNT